jgi:hypothetical protein
MLRTRSVSEGGHVVYYHSEKPRSGLGEGYGKLVQYRNGSASPSLTHRMKNTCYGKPAGDGECCQD